MLHAIAHIEEATGKLLGLQFPQGEIPSEGLIRDGQVRIVNVTDSNVPEQECKTDYQYFNENFVYNKAASAFVKVGHPPNIHATWNFSTGSWQWDADLVLADIRRVRNQKLYKTDWTAVMDNNLTDEQKEEARIYRERLRRITTTLDNPSNESDVTWPTPPSFLS